MPNSKVVRDFWSYDGKTNFRPTYFGLGPGLLAIVLVFVVLNVNQ